VRCDLCQAPIVTFHLDMMGEEGEVFHTALCDGCAEKFGAPGVRSPFEAPDSNHASSNDSIDSPALKEAVAKAKKRRGE
jgi:hypothetical protein